MGKGIGVGVGVNVGVGIGLGVGVRTGVGLGEGDGLGRRPGEASGPEGVISSFTFSLKTLGFWCSRRIAQPAANDKERIIPRKKYFHKSFIAGKFYPKRIKKPNSFPGRFQGKNNSMVYLPKMSPERIGDMDNKSRLIVYRQENGGVVVRILQDDQGQIKRASVKFCTIGSGGGQSPRTVEALVKLIEAIKEDNKEGRFATTPSIAEDKKPEYFDSEPE